MDDEKIVALFLRRDEAALGLTAAKYGLKLRAIANSLLRDQGAAEECENDTYMQAWAAIPPHEPWGYIFPFLAKITRRLAIDVARARSREKRSAPVLELTAELEQCIPSPSDTAGQVDGVLLGELIAGYLRSIQEEQRNMFIRRYWYLDSIKDVAAFFSTSQGRVKTTLYRVRRGLREYLIKEGYDI